MKIASIILQTDQADVIQDLFCEDKDTIELLDCLFKDYLLEAKRGNITFQ